MLKNNKFQSLLFFLLLIILSCSSIPKNPEQRAIYYFEEARVYQKNGDTKRAISGFEEAIRSDSSFLQAYLSLAETLLAQNENKPAEELLLRYTSSRSVRYLFLLGQSQSRQKKWNEAIENLRKALVSGMTDESVYLELASCYVQIDDPKKAITILKEGVRNSNHTQAEILLGKIESQSEKSFGTRFLEDLKNVQVVTRGQFAVASVLILKLPANVEWPVFKDIADTSDLLPYYQKAVSSSFLERLPDSKFYPNFAMTRRNLIFYLSKVLKPNKVDTRSFADLSEKDPIYGDTQNVMAWKIVKPRSYNTIGLQENITGTELLEVLSNVNSVRHE